MSRNYSLGWYMTECGDFLAGLFHQRTLGSTNQHMRVNPKSSQVLYSVLCGFRLLLTNWAHNRNQAYMDEAHILLPYPELELT